MRKKRIERERKGEEEEGEEERLDVGPDEDKRRVSEREFNLETNIGFKF